MGILSDRNKEGQGEKALGREEDKSRQERDGNWLRTWLMIMFVLLILVIGSLRIGEINVIGNETYTDEEAIALIFDESYKYNPIVTFVLNRFFEHKELPFIEDYDIRLNGPFSCDLIIYEKSIVGYISYMNSYMYFDNDGVIVENSMEELRSVPEITGLSFGHIVLNKALPVEDDEVFSEIMNITQQLGSYGIESKEIHFDSDGDVSIFILDGDVEVLLGANSGIDAKLMALRDMLPEIEARGLKGTLDLEDYIEESNNGVSFRVRSDDTEAGEKDETESEESDLEDETIGQT